MKIEKAIEILATYKAGAYEDTSGDLDDALQLGIEALKRLKDGDNLSYAELLKPLPGETDESSAAAEEINPEETID